MRRLVIALGVCVGVWASPAWGQATDRFDCSNFTSQNAAQFVLEADRSDPNHLDADGDGIACEELPRVSTAAQPVPTSAPTAPPQPAGEARTVTTSVPSLPTAPSSSNVPVAQTGPIAASLAWLALGLIAAGCVAVTMPAPRRAGPWDVLPRRRLLAR